MSKAFKIILSIGVVLALALGVVGQFMPHQGVVVRQAGSGPGAQAMGDAWAVDYWGTELAALDTSGNLSVTAGVTAASAEVNGTLTLANDETIVNSTDGTIGMNVAAAGSVNVLTGNLKVGNGTPTVTQDGEDAYVEGQFEVDGEAQFDGAIDANSTSDFAGTAVFSKGSGTALDVSTGGELNVDGTIDANGTADIAGTATFSKGSGTALSVSSGGELNNDGTLDQNGTADFATTATFHGLTLMAFTNLTVTDGYTLTAAATVYALDSAGAVTMTLNADGTEGQLLVLIGDDANNVTIADTNLRSSDGNAIVLGQYDVAMFVYQDAEWVLVSSSANS